MGSTGLVCVGRMSRIPSPIFPSQRCTLTSALDDPNPSENGHPKLVAFIESISEADVFNFGYFIHPIFLNVVAIPPFSHSLSDLYDRTRGLMMGGEVFHQ